MGVGFADLNLALKGNHVQRRYRFLSSLVLTAVLAAPVAMIAAARPQDDDHKEQNKQGENNKRYYDKGHKDYHTWDANEDRSYAQYQTEHHQKHEFVQLNSQQQTNYWAWRHNNPDNR
jgi:hypothetical protein